MKYMIKAILCASIFGSSTYTMQPQTAMGIMNAIAPGLAQTAAIGVGCGGIVPFGYGIFNNTLKGPNFDIIPSTCWGMGAGGILGMAFHLLFSTYSTGSVSLGTARFCTTVFGFAVGFATLVQSNR